METIGRCLPPESGKFCTLFYSDGSRIGQFYASNYDYTSAGGTFGIDYRVDSNWRVGGVFGYSQPEIRVGVQNAVDHIDTYQFAGYGSYSDAHLFFDCLVAYGRQNNAIERDGNHRPHPGQYQRQRLHSRRTQRLLVRNGIVLAWTHSGFDLHQWRDRAAIALPGEHRV